MSGPESITTAGIMDSGPALRQGIACGTHPGMTSVGRIPRGSYPLARRLLGYPLCELFSLAQFAFGLKPEFLIAADGAAVLFPDLTGSPPDSVMARLGQRLCAALEFGGQLQDAVDGLPVADPPGKILVFPGLGQAAGDELLAIHGATTNGPWDLFTAAVDCVPAVSH